MNDGCFVDNTGKWWRRDGQLHRENGPAIEYANGDTAWYQYGKLHREDGPAVDSKFIGLTTDVPHNQHIQHWYWRGTYLANVHSQEEFEKWLKMKAFW
jgi:hypothetical protein